jgi:hypothetical protein
MTSPHLAPSIKAAHTRRVFERATPNPSGMQACLHSAIATMRSGIKAFVSDRHKGGICGSARRASRQIVQGEAEVGRDRFAADLPTNRRIGFPDDARKLSAPGYVTSVTPIVTLARMLAVSLAMIAGILALDLLVLWIAAGKLIERLPF